MTTYLGLDEFVIVVVWRRKIGLFGCIFRFYPG